MVKGINVQNTNFINSYKTNTQQQANIVENKQQGTVLPSNVAIDYNVKIPQSYTKLGVDKLENGQEVHSYKLNNGQRVVIVPMKSPKTYVNTYVNTGALNEKDDERGISHFNEHMAFNGTLGTDGYMKLGIGDVFRKVAEIGGETNASTGLAETNYTIGIPQFNKEDLETAISMQASMMNNLEMPDNMVKKEHGPVCSEINMYSDYMPLKANNIAMKNLYNIQSSSEDVVAGRVDNIQNVDRKKVMDYYKNNYYPANMTTVITGNVNPDEAIGLVAKHFRGENKPNLERRFEKLTPINKTVRRDMASNKAISTNATIAFNGPANNDIKGQTALETAFAMMFLKSDSRIKTPLVNLNSDINPNFNKISTIPTDGQIITFDIESSEENSEQVLNTVFTELNNFKIKDENELKQIKNLIKSRHQDSYENPQNINYMIGSNSFNFGVTDIANQDKILDSLTIKDVEDTVHKYLDTDKASIAVVHPSRVTADSLKDNYNKIHSNNISFKGNSKTTSTEIKPLDKGKIMNFKLNNNYDIGFYDTPNNTNAKAEINYIPTTQIKAKPGVLDVLNRMLKDKTKYKDTTQFGNYLDNNGLTQSIEVKDSGTITVSGKMQSENIQKFIDISQEQLMNPDFDENDLKKFKSQIKDTYSHTQPSAEDGLFKTMYPDSPLGYTPKDIVNNIDNVTLKDVIDCYNNIMANSKATVAVAAPIGDRKVINSVLSSFAQMPQVKPNDGKTYDLYNPTIKSSVETTEAPHSQAEIIQSYNFKDNKNNKDVVTFSLLNRILSHGDTTGLFNNLREKEKLAYAVTSDYVPNGNNSTIQCRILTTTDNPETGEHPYDNIQKSINGFTRQINKMKSGEFTDKELEIAKKEMKDALRTDSYTQLGRAQALSLGLNSPYGSNLVNEKYDAIDTITKEDIQKAANYVFNNKPIYSIVASQNTLDANKNFFEGLKTS